MANELSLENVLRQCGDLHIYQIIHYICLNLITVGTGLTTFYYVFGVAEPYYRCQLPIGIWPSKDEYHPMNSTHEFLINQLKLQSNCKDIYNSTCKEFVYDRSIFGKTFTEEGNYVCEDALKKTWLSTMYHVGGFAVLITGYMGDKIGRRRMIQILTTSVFLVPFVTQLCIQTVEMNIDTKFILLSINQLFASIDAYPMVFLLLMELTSSSHTSLAGNSALVAFTLGEIIITLFAYLCRHWLNLKWIITGYFTLILPYLYFTPESPYWLFSKKKYNQLEHFLRKLAQKNGRSDADWHPLYRRLICDPHLAILSGKHASRSTKEIISHNIPRLMISASIGFITMLLYIKISYGLGAMNDSVSPYWNIVIGAVVEGTGYISASILITTKFGRKYSLMFFLLLTCVCVFTIPFTIKKCALLTVFLSQLGKLLISGAILVTWIYVPELYSTSIRGVSNGVFVVGGRIGAILAPIIDVAVGNEYVHITFYVYSALTIVQLIFLWFLPETRNQSFHTDEDEEEKSSTIDSPVIENQADISEDTNKRSSFLIFENTPSVLSL